MPQLPVPEPQPRLGWWGEGPSDNTQGTIEQPASTHTQTYMDVEIQLARNLQGFISLLRHGSQTETLAHSRNPYTRGSGKFRATCKMIELLFYFAASSQANPSSFSDVSREQLSFSQWSTHKKCGFQGMPAHVPILLLSLSSCVIFKSFIYSSVPLFPYIWERDW